MGIKIHKFLINNVPEGRGIERKHLSAFENQKIAVDFSNITSRILYRADTMAQFAYELINLIHKFKREGIELYFVFDGRPRIEKNYVIQHRRNVRAKLTQKTQELVAKSIDSTTKEDAKMNFEMAYMLSKKARSIQVTHIEEAKKLFDILGVHYIHILDIEADIILKIMVNTGMVDAVFTGDMDSLAYGYKRIIQDLDFKLDTVNEITYDVLLDTLDIQPDEFLSALVLSGTDWNNSLKNSCFVKNMELIKKYGSIPGILEHLDEINTGVPEDHKIGIPARFDWQESITIFSEPIYPELLESIQEDLTRQTANHNLIRSSRGFSILDKFYSSIYKSDTSGKYSRKTEEYLYWKFGYKTPITTPTKRKI